VNTAEEVLRLLQGYEEHDIPVRTILIDSPWSTRYNDFQVDTDRYPDPERFFSDLQDRGYRVVLWMTSTIDSRNKDTAFRDSSDWFSDAVEQGYVAGDGHQIGWWKGKGGFIDYTNPEAVRWWRSLQQNVLDWGIDGWKLDGTATLFGGRVGPIPIPYLKAHGGWLSTRGYMDLYYRKEYEHGLQANPEFVTLVRSVDGKWVHPEGFAPLDAAPVTWVGDQDHTWGKEEEGLEEALEYILQSAKLGYCVVGSDVGGYGGEHIPADLYIRWAQFSAFCGLFLNGGHGERALWDRSREELEIVRKFSWLHTELRPYIYSHVVDCRQGGAPLMRPIEGKYQYLFGDDLLVAPIHTPAATRTVVFPTGRWRNLLDDSQEIEGPTTRTLSFSLQGFPVFVRVGAILPLEVSRPYTGFGDRDSEGFLTLAVYPGETSRSTVHLPSGDGKLEVEVTVEENLRIKLDGYPVKHVLRVFLERKPTEVLYKGQSLREEETWNYEGPSRILWVRNAEPDLGEYEVVF